MEDSNTDKVIKGVHSQALVVAIRAIVSLLYFSIMSRLLTPNDFGYFALITAITTILNSLSEAGLGSSIIQKKDADSEFRSTAFTLSMISGGVFSIILFCFSKQFSLLVCGTGTLTLAFRMMSSIILLTSINNITWASYMKKLHFFKFGILQISAEVLSYLVGIILAYHGFGFYAIVWVSISNQIFLTIILLFLKKYDFHIIIVRRYIKEIVNYGGWLTGAVILRNLTDEIDKIIIGRLLPITDLGALNRPSGFVSRISSNVNGIFDTVLFPILSSIQENPEQIHRAYIKVMTLVAIFSVILASFLTLGSKLIIDVFFGSQWESLQLILIVFSLSLIVNGFSRSADSFFRSLGIVKNYFLARFINWLISILFVIIGCHFGILGASIGMATATFISCIIKYILQYKYVGVNTKILIKNIFNNIKYPVLLLLICSLIMFMFPYGDYFSMFIYCLLLIISILLFPKLFGNVFQEVVIDRYLTKIKNKFLND